MEANLIKRLSAGALRAYSDRHVRAIDEKLGNSTSVVSKSVSESFEALAKLVEGAAAHQLARGESFDERIFSSQTQLIYRHCAVTDPGATEEFVNLLFVGMDDLPESQKTNLGMIAEQHPDQRVCGLMLFIVCAKKNVTFEPQLLVASKGPDGRLATGRYGMQWAVSVPGHTDKLVIGPEWRKADPQTTQRLGLLLRLVSDADAADLYRAHLAGQGRTGAAH